MSCRAAMSPRQLIAFVVYHLFRRAAAATHAKRRPLFQINAGAACAPQNVIDDLSRQRPQRSLRSAKEKFLCVLRVIRGK